MKKEGLFSKLIRQHADPANFVLHVVGITIGLLGLWQRNWVKVFIGFILWPLVGSIYAWFGKARIEYWMMEHYISAMNIILHILGFAVLLYGFYVHDLSFAFIGLGLSMFGHFVVWWQVR